MDEQSRHKEKGKACGCPFCDVPQCPDPTTGGGSCGSDHKIKIHLVDCVGLYCPVPVMRAKEEIDRLAPGSLMEIVADDPAAAEDIPHWAKRTGNTLLKDWQDGEELHFLIQKKVEEA